jgi:hypothetical protein
LKQLEIRIEFVANRAFMLFVLSHILSGSGTVDPTLSLLTQEVSAAGTRLSNALRLEKYFRHLSEEYQKDDVIVRWKASRQLVECTVEDYIEATDRLFEAANRLCKSARASARAALAVGAYENSRAR